MRVPPGRSVMIMTMMVMMVVTMGSMNMMRMSIVMAMVATDGHCVEIMISAVKDLIFLGG
jgi:hypothetical protein